MSNFKTSHFILLFKIVLCLALCFLLGTKLIKEFSKIDMHVYAAVFAQTKMWMLLAFSVLLMPLNWMTEGVKWRLIISSSLEKISYKTAFKAVFTGVAFGNLAPGRATEFAGKIMFISPPNRMVATFLHFVTGAAQLMTTILFGCFGIVFSSFQFPGSAGLQTVFILVLSLLFALLLFFFVNPDKVFALLFRLRWFKKYADQKITITKKTLVSLLSLSLLRHVIFALQYFLIIKCFFSSTNNVAIVNGIFVSLLLVSVVPMFSPVEAFMRGGIGILVFSSIEPLSMNIFISSTLIWIINILLPSAAGLLFFLIRKSESKKEGA